MLTHNLWGEEVAELMGFRTPKQKTSVLKCRDTHKEIMHKVKHFIESFRDGLITSSSEYHLSHKLFPPPHFLFGKKSYFMDFEQKHSHILPTTFLCIFTSGLGVDPHRDGWFVKTPGD